MPGLWCGSRPARCGRPGLCVGGADRHVAAKHLRDTAARVGHDFSGYKDATFLRRVQRRMQVLGMPDMPVYVARLEEDREEAMLLFRDLLIGVTTFFRDAGAFAAVKHVVLPRLFQGKGAGDQVRVWVPGCATGEEAYSIAILLREHMDGLSDLPKVQVFATDIDEPAIGTARAGRYPATLLDGLSPERRDRFFNRHENSYVVAKEIRDLCTFSAHSLVRDPPFSRMNLVSCRNLLIYMDAELQAAVIPSFHYSLLPGGVCCLVARKPSCGMAVYSRRWRRSTGFSCAAMVRVLHLRCRPAQRRLRHQRPQGRGRISRTGKPTGHAPWPLRTAACSNASPRHSWW